MKKIAIVIDRWKLPFFEAELKKAAIVYAQLAGLTEATWILTLSAMEPKIIRALCKRANAASERSKLK